MRISDWSSDVCSSDLVDHRVDEEADVPGGRAGCLGLLQGGILAAAESHEDIGEIDAAEQQADRWHQNVGDEGADDLAEGGTDDNADSHVEDAAPHGEFLELFQHGAFRSAEHTSELQSLMRI